MKDYTYPTDYVNYLREILVVDILFNSNLYFLFSQLLLFKARWPKRRQKKKVRDEIIK